MILQFLMCFQLVLQCTIITKKPLMISLLQTGIRGITELLPNSTAAQAQHHHNSSKLSPSSGCMTSANVKLITQLQKMR